MSVRPYTGRDREACLAIFDTNVPDYFLPSERAEFAEYLDALPGPYLVVTSERRVVACGGWAVSGTRTDEAALCWGMVDGALHRRGFGRMLTQARLDQIRSNVAIRQVVLNTSQYTTTFYERLGFSVIATIHDGYGPGLHRCEMVLALSSQLAHEAPGE
jgi:ribosomal protein S18 acetylase RimI-like enzyme